MQRARLGFAAKTVDRGDVAYAEVADGEDLLTSTSVVRQLPPWHENLGKRQVKAPKVYIADSGLLHTLLEIGTRDDLEGHPKIGASWEGFTDSPRPTALSRLFEDLEPLGGL